jgi:hypothetical protein
VPMTETWARCVAGDIDGNVIGHRRTKTAQG